MKNTLQAGFARININPPLGIGIVGYFIPRFAKGFLDDLEASAMVLSFQDTKVALISVDCCYFVQPLVEECLDAISRATGIPAENIFLSATHTHTGPIMQASSSLAPGSDEETNIRYIQFLVSRLTDVVTLALADLKPAKMGHITGRAPERVAYIRRYKMKDGSTCTCPPINDPNIDHPIGELDQRVHVLRFDQENGNDIILVNYGLHADTVNGELISADWPGWMRRTVEKTLDNTRCMFFAGAEGDVGSTNVHPMPGDMNDTEISFDNEMKSPGMARFVGRALAGTVLQVYDKAAYTDVNSLRIVKRTIHIPSNRPLPEQLPLAHQYKELHEAGRDAEIPFTAMELTTVVAEALRMCRLENGPDTFEMELTGVQIGPVALLGIPGEPFTDIGVALKATPGWEQILPCALTNGSSGYFPMQSAYDEGGYEARSSSFRAGVAELIIEEGKKLLNDLR